MSWSLNIGSVAGTVVRVHLTFLLFLAWIFAASYAQGGATTAWDSLVFMVLLFLCVLLHEFGHIFTARAFGVPTPYVTLLPIGGVAQLERIPEEPGQEFLIAIAGPLVNVVITAALVLFAGAHLQPGAAAAVDNMQIPLVDRLAAVNLFLALFNMIPAFPMDGGRVLRALLASRLRLCARDRDRRVDRPVCRLRARLHRTIVQSDPDLHRDLRLSRGVLGSAHGRAARGLARRAGEPRNGDAVRHAAAAGAYRRGGADLAAHRPGRIPGRRRHRQAGRRARPRRSRPRHQDARAGRPRRRRHDGGTADHRPSPVPGGRLQAAACKSRPLRSASPTRPAS